MKWPMKKLGEVADIIMGQSPPSSTYNTINDGLPFYQGKVDFGDQSPTPRVWCSKPVKISEPYDILICVRAPVGPTNLTREKSCIGRGLAALRSDSKQLDYMYLLFYLRSVERYLSTTGSGTTFSAISKKELENLEIPVPQLNEQKRIVTKLEKILSKISEAKTFRKENFKDANMLIRSALNKVFSNNKAWEKRTIGEVAKTIITGSTPNTKDESFFGGEVKWVTPGDFTGQKWIHESMRTVTSKAVKKGKIRLIPEKAVMLVSIGATVGKLGIASEELATNQQINSMVFDEMKVKPEYAYYYLLKNKETIYDIASASTLPIINKTKTTNLEISYPSIKEQEQIVVYMDSLIEKVQILKKLQEEQLTEFDALRASVLNQAFQGNL